jgi:hypothetical protein
MKKKSEFIPIGDREKYHSAAKRGGVFVPSKDRKGWDFTPRVYPKNAPTKVQITFFGGKGKGKGGKAQAPKKDEAAVQEDPEFVAAAASIGLTPELHANVSAAILVKSKPSARGHKPYLGPWPNN